MVNIPFCELLRNLKNRLAEAKIQAIKWLPGCYECFDDQNNRENLGHWRLVMGAIGHIGVVGDRVEVTQSPGGREAGC